MSTKERDQSKRIAALEIDMNHVLTKDPAKRKAYEKKKLYNAREEIIREAEDLLTKSLSRRWT